MTARASVVTAILVLTLSTARASADAPAVARGTVVSPAGQLVEGAEIIGATPDLAAFPNTPPEARPAHRRGAGSTGTDAAGRFSLGLREHVALLSVHHPTHGYAEVKPALLADAPTVRLQPWCRVEGVLKVGDKPVPAGTTVTLSNFGFNANAARVHYGYDTKTDAQGRYAFDRVPAGLARVDVRLTRGGSVLQRFTGASPDKPARLDVGGAGRPVTGKLVLRGGLDLKNLAPTAKRGQRLFKSSYFRRDVPVVEAPNLEGKVPDQEWEDEVRRWRTLPDTIAAHEPQFFWETEFQPDGSFRYDDVPPGDYQLVIRIWRPGKERNEELGEFKRKVVVPDTPAVPTGEPLDLGEVQLGNEGL